MAEINLGYPVGSLGFQGGYEKGQVYDFHGIRKKWDGRQLRRLCALQGCLKLAVGKQMKCKSHGGGRRCQMDGCTNSAVDNDKCKRHGGGKRCQSDGCNKSAVGTTSFCKMHGGGTRCKIDGCKNSAVSRKLCIRHGGGPRCQITGCKKGARSPHPFCYAHGGGHRCSKPGCNRPARSKTGYCGKCEVNANEPENVLLANVGQSGKSPTSLKRTMSSLSVLSSMSSETDPKRQRLLTPTPQTQSCLPLLQQPLPLLQQNQMLQTLPLAKLGTLSELETISPLANNLAQLSQFGNAMQQYLDLINANANATLSNKLFGLQTPVGATPAAIPQVLYNM